MIRSTVARTLLGVLASFIFAVPFAAQGQGTALDRSDALCRKDLHKTLGRLIRESVKEMNKCHTKRMAGHYAPARDCNVPENSPSPLKVERESDKLRRRLFPYTTLFRSLMRRRAPSARVAGAGTRLRFLSGTVRRRRHRRRLPQRRRLSDLPVARLDDRPRVDGLRYAGGADRPWRQTLPRPDRQPGEEVPLKADH